MERRFTKNSPPLLEERNKNRLFANVSYIIVGKITWNNSKCPLERVKIFSFFFSIFNFPLEVITKRGDLGILSRQ